MTFTPRFALVCIVLLFSTATYARVEIDTTQANLHYRVADSLLSAAEYDSSISYFKKAAVLYGQAKVWQKHINCFNKISKNYWKQSKLDKADSIAKKTLIESLSKLGKNNIEEALAYHNLAIVNRKLNVFNLALGYEQIALKVKKQILGNYHLETAISHGSLAGTYNLIQNFEQSLRHLDSALEIKKKLLTENHLTISTTSSNLGDVYLKKGNYLRALNFHKRAFQIRSNKLGLDHPAVANSYNSLGLVYLATRRYNLALSYFQSAFQIRKKRGELNHYRTANIYNNIGVTHESRGNTSLAREFQRKSLKIRLQMFGEIHKQIASNYINIGQSYFIEKIYDSALYYNRKARMICQALYEEKHYIAAECINNIGLTYQRLKEYDNAFDMFNRAKAILSQIHGEKHPDLAFTFNNIGDTYFLQKQYLKAIESYQMAAGSNLIELESISIYNSLKLEAYLHANELLRALLGKAKSFERIHFESKQLMSLTSSLENYQLCDSLIDISRQSRQNHNDKIDFIKTASQTYEGAIRVALLHYEETQNTDYLDLAFYFSEKSKAGILTDALSNLSAKKFGFIPDSLLLIEQDTKIDLTFYKTQIQKEKSKKSGYDSVKVGRWENYVFQLNRRSDSLVKIMEIDYPKYYDLKYTNETITVNQIQDELSKNDAFIEYFIGDSASYAFLISKEAFDIITLPKTLMNTSNIQKFRETLEESILSKQGFAEKFNAQSHELYQRFLQPVLNKLDTTINKLIIVPSGALNYVPFDILLTEPAENKTSYQKLPYLIHQYQLQYGYSATLLFNDFEQESGNRKSELVAFAPSYENIEEDTSANLTLGRFRDQVDPLKWNTPEVENIEELIGGLTFTGKEAVEKAFIENAQNHNIIHLAMHAIIDDEDPMNSKLVFTQEQDSLNDNYLHAYELYNMELPAELVVLSACETGFGKLAKGEGVMSLGRAFSYAGCPSVVMSHWSVNDATTAKLMKFFYEHLANGMPKDDALRRAKLEFLNQAGPAQSNPYYWGSFVVMGDVAPLDIQKKWSWLYFSVAMAFILLAAVIYKRKKFNR